MRANVPSFAQQLDALENLTFALVTKCDEQTSCFVCGRNESPALRPPGARTSCNDSPLTNHRVREVVGTMIRY